MYTVYLYIRYIKSDEYHCSVIHNFLICIHILAIQRATSVAQKSICLWDVERQDTNAYLLYGLMLPSTYAQVRTNVNGVINLCDLQCRQ